MDMILTELRKLTPKEVEDEVVAKHPNAPLIYGDFTNWEPKPFLDVCELSEKFCPQFTQEAVFRKMKEHAVMSYAQNSYAELTARQKEFYKKYVVDFFEYDTPLNWKEVLERYLPYKKPHMVFAANTRPDFYKTLFVFASMFKVGQHEFIVRSAGAEDPKYYYYSSVSDIRAEDIHHFVKSSQHTTHMRVFNKDDSVFAPWKEDSNQSLNQAVEADVLYWKIGKVIKDEQDYKDVVKLLKDNMAFLKDVYLDASMGGKSTFPLISMVDMEAMCQRAGLMDEGLKRADTDRLYHAT